VIARRLLGLDQPQETRLFLLLGAFGVLIGIGYWFVSHEAAGTALLLGFGLANGVVGSLLATDPAATRVRAAVRLRAEGRSPEPPADDRAGGGTGGLDRPFLDESGRLPSATLAPFAVGLGVATAATAIVFGAAPLVAGVVPLAWGTWTWLRGARDEWEATEAPGSGQAGGRGSGRRSAENR
jgi:hypothetical protein